MGDLRWSQVWVLDVDTQGNGVSNLLHEKDQQGEEPHFVSVSLLQCTAFPSTKPRLNYCTIKRTEPAVT